jgi:hypothetical protein
MKLYVRFKTQKSKSKVLPVLNMHNAVKTYGEVKISSEHSKPRH